MAVFVNDTFTDTNGTSLNAHTPDTGGTWTDTPAPPSSSLGDIESNHLEMNAHFNTARFYNATDPGSADYYVEITLTMNGAHGWDNRAGVLGRVQHGSSVLECYEASWFEDDSPNDEWRLNVWSGGNPTELGSWADAFASGSRTVRLEMIGSAIKVYVDGTERISVTDTTHTAAGRAGITMVGGLLNGVTLDNFTADTVGGGTSDATGSAGGTGAATGIGAATTQAPGTSAGTGTATATGQSSAAGVGSATGTGTATATGRADANAPGTATGTGTATAVGRATTVAVGSASGTGTATGLSSGVGTFGAASGTGTATAVGAALWQTTGTASGAATVSGVSSTHAGPMPVLLSRRRDRRRVALLSTSRRSPRRLHRSSIVYSTTLANAIGSATGTGTATAVGAALVSAVGSAGGTSTAVGISSGNMVGASAGVGSAVAVGASVAAAFGSASGSASVTATATAASVGVGSSSGTSTATAVSSGAMVGSATSTSTALAVSVSVVAAVGSTSASSGAVAVGSSLVQAVGSATGAGVATGVSPQSEAHRLRIVGGFSRSVRL